MKEAFIMANKQSNETGLTREVKTSDIQVIITQAELLGKLETMMSVIYQYPEVDGHIERYKRTHDLAGMLAVDQSQIRQYVEKKMFSVAYPELGGDQFGTERVKRGDRTCRVTVDQLNLLRELAWEVGEAEQRKAIITTLHLNPKVQTMAMQPSSDLITSLSKEIDKLVKTITTGNGDDDDVAFGGAFDD